jgi:Mg2+ and Co2+ transporter CorA
MTISTFARRRNSGDQEMTDDTRDRVIRLEANLEHVTEQLSDMQKKVNEMHDLLMQARGVRWVIIAMAAVSGFVASFASKYLPFVAK